MNRVLIIDDCEVIGEVIKEALEAVDISCDISLTGADAREKILSSDYTTVFLDVNLPDMDSVKLAGLIRTRSLKTQIIVISGKMDEDIYYEYIKLGVNDFFLKNKINITDIQESVKLGHTRYNRWSGLFKSVK